MKKLNRIRILFQNIYASRCGILTPEIIVNSIPKSGTHLVKSMLASQGFRFVGHHYDNGSEIDNKNCCKGLSSLSP